MVKIRDVARRAGVSAMTVSRALNEPDLVSPVTRARVLRAVDELGYIPNAVARSLTQGRTDVIALVVSDIQNPFFTTVSRGVEDVARLHGYTLMLGNTDEQSEIERKYVKALVSRRVDGVLLSTTGADHVRVLQARKIPVVLVDRVIPGINVDAVILDAYDGGRQLATHLIEQGYREITFIGGMPGNSTMEARLAGCQNTFRAAGIELSVLQGRLDRESGEELMSRLCDEGKVPEAIVAANNLVAVGAVVELRRRGLRVPEDLGLACFGEIELASLLDPFLTVIREPAYDVGRQAMQLLHERIRGSDALPHHRALPDHLCGPNRCAAPADPGRTGPASDEIRDRPARGTVARAGPTGGVRGLRGRGARVHPTGQRAPRDAAHRGLVHSPPGRWSRTIGRATPASAASSSYRRRR
jgi:LacI family transcriptional regulator